MQVQLELVAAPTRQDLQDDWFGHRKRARRTQSTPQLVDGLRSPWLGRA